MHSIHVDWPDGRFKLTWFSATEKQMPGLCDIVGAHGCCYYQHGVLLVNHQYRGWEFPGGGREQGESAEECLQRELMEEASVRVGPCTYLGAIRLDNPNWQPGDYWPVESYLTFFAAEVTEVLPMVRAHETQGRRFVPPQEVPRVHDNWHALNQLVLAAGLEALQGPRDDG